MINLTQKITLGFILPRVIFNFYYSAELAVLVVSALEASSALLDALSAEEDSSELLEASELESELELSDELEASELELDEELFLELEELFLEELLLVEDDDER